MRRLAAIFLTLWTCVLLPALPQVAAGSEPAAACGCCRGGKCGSRDCPPPPAPAPALCALDPSARLAPTDIRRAAKPVQRVHGKIFAFVTKRTSNPSALSASVFATPTANVPLFKAHCSFLL